MISSDRILNVSTNDYMNSYFETTDWRTSATTQSGIDSMVVSLEMMGRGISTNLNYISDTERDLITNSGIEITDTYSLSNMISNWAITNNTNYGFVLQAEFFRILAKREPVLQLKSWFSSLSIEECETLYKVITIYSLNKNLYDSYNQALEARRLELVEFDDINLEGE